MKKTARTKTALKLIFILITLFAFLTGDTQNVKQTPDGNFVAIQRDTARSNNDKLTGQYYTDTQGKKYPVYASKNGKLFVIRKSERTGNSYKQYLKLTE